MCQKETKQPQSDHLDWPFIVSGIAKLTSELKTLPDKNTDQAHQTEAEFLQPQQYGICLEKS